MHSGSQVKSWESHRKRHDPHYRIHRPERIRGNRKKVLRKKLQRSGQTGSCHKRQHHQNHQECREAEEESSRKSRERGSGGSKSEAPTSRSRSNCSSRENQIRYVEKRLGRDRITRKKDYKNCIGQNSQLEIVDNLCSESRRNQIERKSRSKECRQINIAPLRMTNTTKGVASKSGTWLNRATKVLHLLFN